MMTAIRSENFLLTVVIPCYNEEAVIRATYNRICEILGNRDFRLQPIFINDGSQDGTQRILDEILIADPRVKVLTLARNFGHQAAVSAGLANSDGDATVVIDADLQDPPQVILEMIAKWHEGFDIIYGVRTRRKEAIWKRICYDSFYKILRAVSDIPTPLNAGDFSLIDRQVLGQINQLPEKNRFFRGLRAWVGFTQTGVVYERHSRVAGSTKYPFIKLLKLAADGVFNFSTVPLTIVFILGLLMSVISLSAAVTIFVFRAFDLAFFGLYLRDVQGFASTILTVLLIGGIQLICTGILGEYVGRIYEEVKSRPSYIVRESPSSQPGSPGVGSAGAVEAKSSLGTAGENSLSH